MNKTTEQTTSPEYDAIRECLAKPVRCLHPGYGLRVLQMIRGILPELLEAPRTDDTGEDNPLAQAFRPTEQRVSSAAYALLCQATQEKLPGNFGEHIPVMTWEDIQNFDPVLIEAALDDAIEAEAPRTGELVRLRNTLAAGIDGVREVCASLTDREKFLILAMHDLLIEEWADDGFVGGSLEFQRDKAVEFQEDPQIGPIAKAVLATIRLHEIE